MLKDDLLHIPDCLNRALWTEERVKANEASCSVSAYDWHGRRQRSAVNMSGR